jgi:hypothetical protein
MIFILSNIFAYLSSFPQEYGFKRVKWPAPSNQTPKPGLLLL